MDLQKMKKNINLIQMRKKEEKDERKKSQKIIRKKAQKMEKKGISDQEFQRSLEQIKNNYKKEFQADSDIEDIIERPRMQSEPMLRFNIELNNFYKDFDLKEYQSKQRI